MIYGDRERVSMGGLLLLKHDAYRPESARQNPLRLSLYAIKK
jgi:hypothetical protein